MKNILSDLSKQNIVKILSDDSLNDELFSFADKIRHDNVGDDVHLRGLIEFSNICKRSCKYCGLRAGNKEIERYRITPKDIITCAKKAVDRGYKTIVLQSGEDDFYSKDLMCEIITEIKKFNTALTLSIGERSFEDYEAFKKAGADRYLLRIETTDENLYSKLHPNMDFKNRLRCLNDLKKLGYEVGTGCLIGLPNQSVESLADDILFFKNLKADMVGVGPFISHPNTPLKNCNNGDFILALKVMALVRITMPKINIPATTAMETLNQNGRIIALKSGANVVMPNVTTKEFRKKYEIYPNKICIDETPDKCRHCIEVKIKSIGRNISDDFGISKSFNKT